MSPTMSTFLLEAVNFLLLAGALGFLLFKPVRAALERKRAEMETQTSEAAAKLAEAEKLREEAGKERAALEEELQKRREEAKAEAEKESSAILERAREAARRERESARKALSELSEAELDRLADAVAETTARTVGKLLSRLSSRELDRELVGAACRELRSLDGDALGRVVVETPSEIDEETRRELEEALGEAARDAEFRVLPDLGTGIRVTTKSGLVDASASGLADYARRSLAGTLTAPTKKVERSS